MGVGYADGGGQQRRCLAVEVARHQPVVEGEPGGATAEGEGVERQAARHDAGFELRGPVAPGPQSAKQRGELDGVEGRVGGVAAEGLAQAQAGPCGAGIADADRAFEASGAGVAVAAGLDTCHVVHVDQVLDQGAGRRRVEWDRPGRGRQRPLQQLGRCPLGPKHPGGARLRITSSIR